MRSNNIKSLSICPILILIFVIDLYAQGNFVYVNNNDPFQTNSVSGFSVAPDGALAMLPGSPFLTGGTSPLGAQIGPTRIVISPVADLLFASNTESNDVSAFAINPQTGNLTLIPGSPFPTGGFARLGMSLAISPDGKFLFAGHHGSGSISIFKINPDGSLTPIPDSPFFTGGSINDMKVTPNGRFLIVSIGSPPGLALVLSISPGGSLSMVPSTPTLLSGFPTQIEINCAGSLLFVLELHSFTTDHMNVFRIGPDGSLAQVPGAPFDLGLDGFSYTLSSDGGLLFVGTSFPDGVSVQDVAASGSLSPSPNPFLPVVGAPVSMAMNRMSTHLFTMIVGGVHVATVSAGGALTTVPGSPFRTNASGLAQSIAAYPPKVCVVPFEFCIQDDSNGNILRINLDTGEYQFTDCSGLTLGGVAALIKKGGVITLQHFADDRRVVARIDTGVNRATASIQIPSQTVRTIVDRDTANNVCACR